MRKRFTLCLLLALAAAAAAQETPEQIFESKVTEIALPNGLRFLVVKRGDAPTFFGMAQFKVGSVDEVPGITGLAHMFEHMAFKGTESIGTKDFKAEKPLLDDIEKAGDALSLAVARGESEETLHALRARLHELEARHAQFVVAGEFNKIYTENGATRFNASTNSDFTTYIVALPSSRLELWMLLESERFKNPVMREFYRERDVVMEERRLRTETQPEGAMYETAVSVAFMAHPYRIPTIGYMSDLKTMTMADARRFFKTYYVPQRAVLTLVGDVDAEKVRVLAKKYFGDIPAAPDPPPVRTIEPPQAGERRAMVKWDSEPSVSVSYHVPTVGHPDHYALDMLVAILGEGQASRLEKALVEKGIAAYNWVSRGPGYRYPHLLGIWSAPLSGHGVAEVEEAIYRELERLKTEPVPERELERIRNRMEAEFWKGLGSNFAIAFQLSASQLIYGDWREALQVRQKLNALTPEDLMRAARTHFTPENRTVVVVGRTAPAENAAPVSPSAPDRGAASSGKTAKKNRKTK
jgi:predicted Zn-dependent peptidase